MARKDVTDYAASKFLYDVSIRSRRPGDGLQLTLILELQLSVKCHLKLPLSLAVFQKKVSKSHHAVWIQRTKLAWHGGAV